MQVKMPTAEMIDIALLKPYKKNTKRHNQTQIDNVAESIRKFGFVQPFVIDKNNEVVIGHCRLLAAQKLGIKQLPCVRVDYLTSAQVKALRILDNKLNESEWDLDFLNEELPEIDLTGFDVDFDFALSTDGFDEIVEDEPPAVDEQHEPMTKVGDVWQLGEHRLMCGDSTLLADVERVMQGDKADMIFTDPPYNVDYQGGGKEKLKIANDNFATDEECGQKLWLPAFENMRNVSKDCCSYYCCMPQGGTHMMMMMMMMMKAGWQVKHELIWEKQSIVLNRADYNYQHEPILFGWNIKHTFYGKGEYSTTSVWKFDRPTKSKEHPTMKPIALIGEALKNSSKQSDIIFDPFGGSGSTLIACEQLGRKCRTIEIAPKYCDVIIRRWETITGQTAVRL